MSTPTVGDLTPVVNSHTEWDPLEEVIVGILDGAVELPWEIGLQSVIPHEDLDPVREYHLKQGGKHFFPQQLEPAKKELDEFIHILKAEGVNVRFPDPIDHQKACTTLDWTTPSGNSQAKPRDLLIVIGNELIEATMSWRSRYFEFRGYRSLAREYFRRGAKWTTAPKPLMTDELYNPSWKRGVEYVTTEFEPVFDAADIARIGKDLVIQRSNVTNLGGIEWLRRHLGDTYRIHTVEFGEDRPIHIDASFVPLAPGKVVINPDRPIKRLPEIFKGWDLLVPPPSTQKNPKRPVKWLHLNTLSLDEKRIIVEKDEELYIRALRDWGFTPIPCPFKNNYRYGGSFHCSTTDIRRRGALQSYF